MQANVPLAGSGSLTDLIKTASGLLIEARDQAAATIELGKIGIEKGKETYTDVKRRAGQVGEGLEMLKEGKKMVEEGIGTK